MNEFDIIERYLLPLTGGNPAADGLRDDAAVLSIPDEHELVVTSDTLNENVHFMIGDNPENIARKALRVNLSDLASMGAKPLCYQLNIAFPERPDDDWLSRFSNTLKEDNETYDIFCSGGDTTSIKGGFLSVSITAMGIVPKGKAVRRSGAKAGDHIVITGSVGDAYLGLKALQNDLDLQKYSSAVSRYYVPQPRMGIEGALRKYVNAAADISDGFVADCIHIAKSSGLRATIFDDKITFSKDVQLALDEGVTTKEDVLSGGDDYELILAVSPENSDYMIRYLYKKQLNPMLVGEFLSNDSSLPLLSFGSLCIDDVNHGWKHF